jgi:hypothetical protein
MIMLGASVGPFLLGGTLVEAWLRGKRMEERRRATWTPGREG